MVAVCWVCAGMHAMLPSVTLTGVPRSSTVRKEQWPKQVEYCEHTGPLYTAAAQPSVHPQA